MLMSGAPLSYMQEALYIWLQQKPPDKSWPTISHLCKALKTDVIDEDVLAADVEKALVGELLDCMLSIFTLRNQFLVLGKIK